MEKVCEFCTALRPLVYCKADAAYLCLSCDAKVHLANALSGRHLRTLVCNLCRYHLAFVQCLEHKMLICRDCDQKLHMLNISSPQPHHKRAIRSFMGCPSVKDFAKLWGFEVNEIENGANQDLFAPISCVSADLNVVKVKGKRGASVMSMAKLDGGSSSQQGQILHSVQERQIILQQIVDLKRLQMNEEINHSTKINGQQEKDLYPSPYHALKNLDEKANQQAQNSQDLATGLLENDSPVVEMNPEALSSTFSQLDNLSSTSNIDLPLHGESFWTCKSPHHLSNQLWSQNIQDLGICEELVCQDDFDIPDVDLSFQNYEELFGGDQDPIRIFLGDKDASCSSLDKDISVDKSDIDNPCAVEDSSTAASMTMFQTDRENKDMDRLNHYCPRKHGSFS